MNFYSKTVPTIRYVSALCGSGKTYRIAEYVASRSRSEAILYVAPTRRLLSQFQTELKRLGAAIKIIDSDHTSNTTTDVVSTLGDSTGPPIVGITSKTFCNLPFFPKEPAWSIVIDEIPQVDQFYPLMVPRSHTIFSQYLEVHQTQFRGVGRVRAADWRKLKNLTEGPKDSLQKDAELIFRDVLYDRKIVYTDMASWNKMAISADVSKGDKENRIFFLSMLNPMIFDNAIIVGANFQDSMLHRWLNINGGIMDELGEVVSKLREPPDLSKRVEIHYLLEQRYSKYIGNKRIEGVKISDLMDDAAAQFFGDSEFLYVTNRDHTPHRLADLTGMKQISPVSHGLNSYSNYHNIYFSAALNREPMHLSMLEALGFKPEQVRKATVDEGIYQCGMRTSLRNPDATEIVKIIVPDKASAEELARKLGCTTVHRLGEIDNTRKTPLDNSQKKARSKANKVMNEIMASDRAPIPSYNEKGARFDRNTGQISHRLVLTIHEHLDAYLPTDFLTREFELRKLVSCLRTLARGLVETKEERSLMIFARFNPREGKGYRRQEHFVQSGAMVLDFDGGSLSPERFVEIFHGNDGPRLSFIVTNTFNRTADAPNRFRSIVFYREPAKSIAEHQAVFDYLETRLRQAGYDRDSSKLDKACLSGVQPFYLPCTNRSHPEMAFFDEFGTTEAEVRKYGISPAECLEALPRQVVEPTRSKALTPSSSSIAEMEDQLRAMTEDRRPLFYRIARVLAKSGANVEEELKRIAGSDKILQQQIRGHLYSIKHYPLIT